MSFGYMGKILIIDLTDEKIEIEKPDDDFYRSYMGGSTIGAYYLLKELKPGVDPLGPDNIMVVSTSIVTGIPSPGFSRFNITAKSPLTGCLGETQAGGFFGAELKFSGYDGLIIKGKLKKPGYILIRDEKVEIKNAEKLWGQTTKETENIIRKQNDDSKIRILTIGKGAENLVRYGCISTDLNHINGRNGLGAVMASKNLKAIAVRGTKKVNIKDMKVIKEVNKYFRDNFKDNPSTKDLNLIGTSAIVNANNLDGQLPSYNFRTSYFKHAEDISGEKMNSELLIKSEGCYACPVRCKKIVKNNGKYKNDPDYGAPEYETLASLGSNCGISDLEAIVYANELCNKFTIDSISTGVVIAFAMECYENGIINKEDTNGIELKFGNTKAMIEIIKKIVNREGIGDILADGVKIAAKRIGRGAEKYAMHTKGQELPMHAARGKGMLAFSYAFSPIGADHLVAEHDIDFDFNAPELYLEQAKSLGIYKRIETTSIDEEKVKMFCILQNHFSFMDCLCICLFIFAPVRVFKMKHLVDIVSAVTGWETSLWEIMRLGEKRVNMIKCFNAREGIDINDDVLPERMYEPLESGPKKGRKLDRDEFKIAQKLYYRMRNWDSRSIPTKAKLYELDLGWIIDDLESNGIKINV